MKLLQRYRLEQLRQEIETILYCSYMNFVNDSGCQCILNYVWDLNLWLVMLRKLGCMVGSCWILRKHKMLQWIKWKYTLSNSRRRSMQSKKVWQRRLKPLTERPRNLLSWFSKYQMWQTWHMLQLKNSKTVDDKTKACNQRTRDQNKQKVTHFYMIPEMLKNWEKKMQYNKMQSRISKVKWWICVLISSNSWMKQYRKH